MPKYVSLSFVAAIVLSLLTIAPPAGAQADDAYPMYFPVVGDNYYSDTYTAPRSSGIHGATDIMADKMTPVVAVADGVIGGQASDGTYYPGWFHGEGNCCDMEMVHDDGWSSTYIHLNNDTPGTDDGLGWGFAPGIEPGVHVEAGQLIGWVGDSGNAEWTAPHLHFELRNENDELVNPYDHLLTATVLDAPWDPAEGGEPPPDLGGPIVFEGSFSDDDNSVHQGEIERLFERGLTVGCVPDDNLYCPADQVTRGQLATFLQRYLALPEAASDYYTDDDSSVHEAAINALTEAGIAFGCAENDYCGGSVVTRAELAAFFVYAFGYPPSSEGPFIDIAGNAFEAEINALAGVGLTSGCDEEAGLYCPSEGLTRAQYASFMMRAIDYIEAASSS